MSAPPTPPGPQPPPFSYRPDLDGLRAVAVLVVVVYHLVPAAAPGGFVGVDVFFVLSGFLITALTHRRIAAGTFTFLGFYARRARRLLPALVAVVGATLVVGDQLYGPIERSDLGAAGAAAALFGANLHFFATGDYFAAPVETQPLLHLWSLGVEEQFYLLAPVALVALARHPRARLWGTLAAVFGSLAAGIWATHHHPRAAFYLPVFRAWELGLGALLALHPWQPASAPGRSLLATAGLAAIAAATWGFDEGTPFPGWAALVPSLGALAVLAAGPDSRPGRLLAWSPLRAIGRWSYAWYLWHWPLLAFATFWWMRPPTLAEALGLGLGSLGIAAASTRWLEAPLRHGSPDSAGRAVRRGLAAVFSVALLGGSMWAADRPTGQVGALLDTVARSLDDPAPDCHTRPTHGGQAAVCALGSPDHPLDLVLWGDSHAAVLASAVGRLAEERGAGGLAVGRFDCLPVLGVDRADVYAEHRCARHNDLVLEHLERVGVRTVVLHARWPLYASGSRYGDRGTVPRLVRRGSQDQPVDLPAALDDTVRRLRAIGAEVVLLGSVPEVRFDVESVLARSARLQRDPPPGPTRAELEDRRAAARAAFGPALARPHVHFVDPADALCDARQCRISDGTTPLYTDDNHVSRAGATRVVDLLRPYVSPAP